MQISKSFYNFANFANILLICINSFTLHEKVFVFVMDFFGKPSKTDQEKTEKLNNHGKLENQDKNPCYKVAAKDLTTPTCTTLLTSPVLPTTTHSHFTITLTLLFSS